MIEEISEKDQTIKDDKILLRISVDLLKSMDQVIRERIRDPKANRSEFVRRSIRYTIDNIDNYLESEAATIDERTLIKSIKQINAVRDIYESIHKYTESVLIEPGATLAEKRQVFLIRLIGQMIFEMSDKYLEPPPLVIE